MSFAARVSSTPAGSSSGSIFRIFSRVTQRFSSNVQVVGVPPLSSQASQDLIFAASLNETNADASNADNRSKGRIILFMP